MLKSQEQLLQDMWALWVTDVNGPGNTSQDEATDILQTFTGGGSGLIDDATGDAWWVAIATEYDALGIINQPTYVQLRNEINQAGDPTGNDLFAALMAKLLPLPETRTVAAAMESTDRADELGTRIPADRVTVETALATETDPALIDALNAGLRELDQREALLQ